MSLNRIGIEENELVMQIEDLPSYNFTILAEVLNSQKKLNEKFVALEFINNFDGALKYQRLEELGFLYDYAFNKLSNDYFHNKYWPTTAELEREDDNLEIDFLTMNLYNELTYRHIYARLQHWDSDIRARSWDNYMELFEFIIPKKNKKYNSNTIELPGKWVWDMLDEFIYQFQNFCFFRSKIKSAQDTNYNKLLENESLPNLHDVKSILNRFIKESEIIDENGKMRQIADIKTIHLFGYYSIVALCKLHVIIGETEEALNVIAPIDYSNLKVYSKSWSCLNSLYYYAGMAYLLNKKYIQATKLLETIVSFSNKYKHFFIKSFQYDNIMKQMDRALLLLCICLSLNQIPINAVVKNLITDKYNDKFERLLKYDKACFEESFTHGSCKMTTPLLQSSDFKNNGFLENTRDPMVETVNKFLAEFTKSQILNNVEGVLDLYPTITLKKFAKIMDLQESEVTGILQDFKTSKNLGGASTPFDATVVSKITSGVKFIEFSVVGDEIHVDMDIKEESHINFFQRHCNGLESMISKIELL